MVTTMEQHPSRNRDAEFARTLARATGKVLRRTREQAGDRPLAELKDLGDRSAQAEIAARLAAEYPDDAVLSEEAPDDPVRLGRPRVWIIDPLDGTREYAEGRPDWAVHVALWEGGPGSGAGPVGDLTVGAVALPDEDLVLSSADGAALAPRSAGPLRIAVSRTRPPSLVAQVVDRLAAAGTQTELVPMGSAGVKITAVIRGQVDAYLHAGGQYQWDSAAPVCVARAAGAHTCRVDGSPLVYNQPDPYLPDLVVCRPEFRDAILRAIAG
jgi:3'(2'), 5'-bisphosphate nucleotidase